MERVSTDAFLRWAAGSGIVPDAKFREWPSQAPLAYSAVPSLWRRWSTPEAVFNLPNLASCLVGCAALEGVLTMRKSKTPVYAVIRIDNYSAAALEDNITVKEIVWSLEEAEAEVARLNELNDSKGCRYFWQLTRLITADAENESRGSK